MVGAHHLCCPAVCTPSRCAPIYTSYTLKIHQVYTIIVCTTPVCTCDAPDLLMHTVFTKNVERGAKTVYTGIHHLEVHTIFAHTLCNQGVHCVYTMF